MSLGVPERGETTKTGVTQGVRVDRDGIAVMLLRYKIEAGKAGTKRFFVTAPAKFWARWRLDRQYCR